jgi:drug/metabolite transporter (DMT)-like permease
LSGSTALVPRLEVLAAAALFSTGGAAIKATSLSAWQVAGFRSALAAVVLYAALPAARRFWHPRALAVGAAYATTMVLFVAGNKLTTAANTIFLQSTAPLWLLLLGPLALREPVRRAEVGYAIALGAGLVLFFVGGEPAYATAPDPYRGNLVAAVSGAFWALTIFGLRGLARDERPGAPPGLSAVVAGNVLAAVVCLPAALPVGERAAIDWLVIAHLGLLQIGLAYVFMTRGMRRLAALEVSLLLLLEPVLSACWAWLVHGERPGAWPLAGCAIILGATAVHVLRRS